MFCTYNVCITAAWRAYRFRKNTDFSVCHWRKTRGIIISYLFGEFAERERQIYRPRLAVVNGKAPRAAAPLAAGFGQLRLCDGHVSVGTPVQRVRNEPTHGERVERQLKEEEEEEKKVVLIDKYYYEHLTGGHISSAKTRLTRARTILC